MLLDANIIIDFRKGNIKAKQFLEKENNLSTSIIVVMEVIAGISTKRTIAEFENFLKQSQIEIYSLDENISKIGYHLFITHHHECHISVADAFIAATAAVHKETLATLNIKHFQKLPEIKVIKPY